MISPNTFRLDESLNAGPGEIVDSQSGLNSNADALQVESDHTRNFREVGGPK